MISLASSNRPQLVGLVILVAMADKENNPPVLPPAKKKRLSLSLKKTFCKPVTEDEAKLAAKGVTQLLLMNGQY